MSYYQTNAVYEELDRREVPNLVWVTGSEWLLIYADSNLAIRALVNLREESGAKSSKRSDLARAAVRKIAERGNVPWVTLKYQKGGQPLTEVEVTLQGESPQNVTMAKLRNIFSELGIPPVPGKAKPINSATSNPYHDWQQREFAGLKVSDLDLIRLNEGLTEAVEVVELKRSFIPLDSWNPYPDDYNNFELVRKFVSPAEAKFTIAYNVRTKNPWKEHIENMALFDYSARHSTRIAKVSFNNFVDGSYLTHD